MSVEMAFR